MAGKGRKPCGERPVGTLKHVPRRTSER